MKRLTKSGGSYCDNCSAVNDEFCSCCDEKAMYKKLSEYEDTGLEPNEIPKWISVKDRLPEFKERVLAYVKNKDSEGRFNREGVYVAQLEDKVPKHDPEGKRNFWGIPGYDSEWTVWAWSYFTEPEVTHWRPLPEPPKEEKDGEPVFR